MHSKKPTIKRTNPCPMSPNITPNKNGKVTCAKRAGLTSLYSGTP